jgi:hypothetical protein
MLIPDHKSLVLPALRLPEDRKEHRLAEFRQRLARVFNRPVKPLPRHAELAVNMAGSMASFLLATFESKR